MADQTEPLEETLRARLQQLTDRFAFTSAPALV